jgi:hypothetical protein
MFSPEDTKLADPCERLTEIISPAVKSPTIEGIDVNVGIRDETICIVRLTCCYIML